MRRVSTLLRTVLLAEGLTSGIASHPPLHADQVAKVKGIKRRGLPQKLTLDGYAASHVAVGELQEEGILPTTLRVRTNRYLNNLIEQDLGRGKQRMRPALGDHATTTITGIELVY